jgi:hypothetical protein
MADAAKMRREMERGHGILWWRSGGATALESSW